MITRKITYRGTMNDEAVGIIFRIARKNEITGQVKTISPEEIQLNLEGDAAMIKLIQHQIEREAKEYIKDKTVEVMQYQYYVGVTLLN
ncbi:MAG TPA: hypothetical protein VNJ01_06460 [Bacteriovoracaceae bacterium]|nr:hypothetical protein [Bacteriovoracaceae bacterium]